MDGQTSLSDFKQPVGMNLKERNRGHSVLNRIVSVSQSFTRTIVRGKTGKADSRGQNISQPGQTGVLQAPASLFAVAEDAD